MPGRELLVFARMFVPVLWNASHHLGLFRISVVSFSSDDVIFKDGVLYICNQRLCRRLGKRRNFGVQKQSIWFPRWDSVWSSMTFSNPNHILCMSTAGAPRDETRGLLLIQAVCMCVTSCCGLAGRAHGVRCGAATKPAAPVCDCKMTTILLLPAQTTLLTLESINRG